MYLAFGPGEGTATINYDGEQKKFMFNALDKRDRTRYYRVQLKGEYTLEGNNCGSFMNFDAPKLVSESSATRVITFRTGYSNAVDKGACEVFLKSTPTTATRTVSVSLGALDFRISLGIYDVLPSGKHLFSVTLNDYIRIKERKNNVVINDRLAAGPVYVSGYINLKASLSFRLLSDAGKTMMFDPNNTVVDFFRVQGEFKTNFLAITTTVNCQYIHEGKCALFDGNSYLPLSIGVRSDYLVRNTSTVTLKPGVPQKLTGPLGFKIGTKAPIQYMFGLSREDVMANPASFGREFSGDVTMIVEGDF
ncbi:hypothetical protein AUC60_21445 [Pseudomonas caspiana]|uniref:Uncharacterized protein n=1 Tax=Pseudomonas caspiana TaxID=1451454 RepID=A0A1Y3NWD4_9PSED|nr:hypothetical protein AUC60_21445 [Pseudomonas caspiana]